MKFLRSSKSYPYGLLFGYCIIWYATSTTSIFWFTLLIATPQLIITPLGRVFCLLICGICYAEYTAINQLQWQLPINVISENHLVVGTVIGLPVHKKVNQQLHIQTESSVIRFQLHSINGQVLSKNDVYLKLSCKINCPKFKAADQWRLLVRLKPANGYVNPIGFDYEKWLFAHGYRASGYIIDSNANQLLSQSVSVHHLREYLRNFFNNKFTNRRIRASIIALTIGIRDELSRESKQKMAMTGLSHLMAISGLHIGLSALPGFILGGFIWRLPIFSQRFNRQVFQWNMSLIPAAFYTALAGFGLPAVRALIMLLVFCWVHNKRLSVSTFVRFGLALILILLIQPLAVLQTSFWLSFMVTGILIALGTLKQPSNKMIGFIKLQAQLFFCIIPIQLLLFGKLSLLSPLINLIAIPFVSLILLPILLFLICLVFLTPMLPIEFLNTVLEFVLKISEVLMVFFWSLVDRISIDAQSYQLSLSDLIQTPLSLVFVAIYVSFLLVKLLKYKNSLRLFPSILMPSTLISSVFMIMVIMIIMITIMIKAYFKSDDQSLIMTVLDVGQGLALTIQYDHKIIIYDTAYGIETGHSVAQRTLIPWLEYLRDPVELLFVSHNDIDHSGGLADLLKNIPVNESLLGVSIKQQLVAETTRSGLCVAGKTWQWRHLKIKILFPKQRDNQFTKGNNSSCVVLLEIFSNKILLTGDIEFQAETELIKYYPKLRANVLLSPHHGSKTSSSLSFIKSIQPDVAIISSGYLNRFNHPSKSILKRYKSLSIKAINTADSGAIKLTIIPSGRVHISQFRQDYPTLWRRH